MITHVRTGSDPQQVFIDETRLQSPSNSFVGEIKVLSPSDSSRVPLPVGSNLHESSIFSVNERKIIDMSDTNGSETTKDVLKNLRKLSSITTAFSERVKTCISATKKSFHEEAGMHDMEASKRHFATLEKNYKEQVDAARANEQLALVEIDKLTKYVSISGGSAKRLSADAYERMQIIGANLEGINSLQESFEESLRSKKTDLIYLREEWSKIVSNLDDAHSDLLWLKHLMEKPVEISLVRYESEYNAHPENIVATIERPSLQQLPDPTPLVERLTQLKEQTAKVANLADNLEQFCTVNTASNIETITSQCLSTATEFSLVNSSVTGRRKEVEERLAKLKKELKDGRCKELSFSSYDALGKFGVNVDDIVKAEKKHQRVQNDRETEISKIKSTWQSTLKTIGIARDKINAVIDLINATNGNALVEKLVIQTDPGEAVTSLKDRVDQLVEKSNSLFRSVDDAVEKAKGNGGYLSGATEDQIKDLRAKYTELYNEYHELVKEGDLVVQELHTSIENTQKKITKNTVSVIDQVALNKFMEDLGKAKGKEKEYANEAASISQAGADIQKKYVKNVKNLGDLEKLLAGYQESVEQTKIRLTRLSQAYKTGSLPKQLFVTVSTGLGSSIYGTTDNEPLAPNDLLTASITKI